MSDWFEHPKLNYKKSVAPASLDTQKGHRRVIEVLSCNLKIIILLMLGINSESPLTIGILIFMKF